MHGFSDLFSAGVITFVNHVTTRQAAFETRAAVRTKIDEELTCDLGLTTATVTYTPQVI